MKRFVAILFLIPLLASGATWYVDNAVTGSSDNSGGSWANAFTNLSFSWASIAAGDTITFSKGDYGDRQFIFGKSGSASSPITINISPEAGHNGYVTFSNGITFNAKNWVTLNGSLSSSFPTNLVISNLWNITNNCGFRVTSMEDTNGIHMTSGNALKQGAKVFWCEVFSCGSAASGNENAIASGASGDSTSLESMEIGYCWIHDNIYGDSINILDNRNSLANSVVIHHCLLLNTGDDFVQGPGGMTVCWCILRERTRGVASGHTDVVQVWGGGSFRSSGTNDPVFGNVIFHHNSLGDVAVENGYGSWAYFQMSGSVCSNLWFYNNLLYDTSIPVTNEASAGWAWTADGFYDRYNPTILLSNVYIFNNLFCSGMHQAMITSQPTGEDWRLGSGESETGGRGFLAGWSAADVWIANNIVLDCYTNFPSDPVFSFPYTNAVVFTFAGGSNTYTTEVFGPTNVTAQASYGTNGVHVFNNVFAGPNTSVRVIRSNVWATAEAMNAGLGYSGNTSARPVFSGYTRGGTNWDFRLSSADSAAVNAGLSLATWTNTLPDLNLDLDGNVRGASNLWTIGPYENANLESNLLVWFSFGDDFTNAGYIADQSGNGRNGLRYGFAGRTTNFPVQITGTNGLGAQFGYYFDGSTTETGRSGDYAAITNLGPLLLLTQATFTAWCKYYPAVSNVIGNDHNATILDAGYTGVGTWHFGRYYSTSYGNTKFFLMTNGTTGRWFVPAGGDDSGWPENYVLGYATNKGASTNGGGNGWHHYAVTVDCSSGFAVAKSYFQGTNVGSGTTTTPVPYLTCTTPGSGDATNRYPWLAVGCWTHSGTARMGDSDDYPNNGWLNGAIDEVRIYNRILSTNEIAILAGFSGSDGGGSTNSPRTVNAVNAFAGRIIQP